jgi:hypothetical protein
MNEYREGDAKVRGVRPLALGPVPWTVDLAEGRMPRGRVRNPWCHEDTYTFPAVAGLFRNLILEVEPRVTTGVAYSLLASDYADINTSPAQRVYAPLSAEVPAFRVGMPTEFLLFQV